MTTRVRTIVFWGAYDTTKPRVRLLLEGARAAGYEVVEVQADVWRDVRDKSQLGPAGWLRVSLRMLAALPSLLWRYARAPAHDWVVAGYPGLPLALLLWPLARLRGARVAWDVFISAWDTVVRDRRLLGPRHPVAMMLFAGEYVALRVLDRPFMDTQAYARAIERLYRLAQGRMGHIWVGVEERLEAGTHAADGRPAGTMRVLFYGQFSPLHGVDVVVEAARRVARVVDDVSWTIVGVGQTSAAIDEELGRTPVPRVERRDWVPYEELGGLVRASDVCLGVFGTSEKALAVIPNKVFQVLAAGGRVVTADGDGIRELLTEAPAVATAVTTVKPGEAQALADAVLSLKAQWRAGTLPSVSPWAMTVDDVGRQLARLLEGSASSTR
jgi:glycosyltransferase involved in cell wall biosynthesis